VTKFDYGLNFKKTDFRREPGLYRVGIGEQGVLLVEPYKSEILPHWRFKTPDIARESAERIYEFYLQYKADGDFVGMDMARKFLQMGYTRARRYANHRTGRKYKKGTREVLPREMDDVKAESAKIFYEQWQRVRSDVGYNEMKAQHREKYDTDVS